MFNLIGELPERLKEQFAKPLYEEICTESSNLSLSAKINLDIWK